MEGDAMKRIGRISIAVAGLSLILMLGACQKEGPAERAGEKIDQAMEKEGPAEQAGEKIDQAMETVQEKTEEAVKQVESETREVLETTEAKLEEAGESLREATKK